MKFNFSLILPMVIIFNSSLAQAENLITLSEGVKLIAINGEVTNDSLLNRHDQYSLPDGKNQLLVAYTADIKNGNEYELEETAPTIISFSERNKQINISTPELLTERAIEQFNKNQNWVLKTKGNLDINYKATLLPLSGFRLGVNYERELRDFNQSNLSTVYNTIPHTKDIVKTSSAECSEQDLILMMLNQLYVNAQPETQKLFTDQIIE